jgi:hypothetical protein
VQTTRELPYLVAGLREQGKKVFSGFFPESHSYNSNQHG